MDSIQWKKLLYENKLNELAINDGNSFAQEVEKTIKKHFPKSYVAAQYNERMLPVVVVYFAVGRKPDWYNGIFQNDVASTVFFIYGFSEDGNLDSVQSLDTKGGLSLKITPQKNKHLAYERIKVPFRSKKGTPDAILKSIDKGFELLKKSLKDNFNLLTNPHQEYVKKYI